VLGCAGKGSDDWNGGRGDNLLGGWGKGGDVDMNMDAGRGGGRGMEVGDVGGKRGGELYQLYLQMGFTSSCTCPVQCRVHTFMFISKHGIHDA